MSNLALVYRRLFDIKEENDNLRTRLATARSMWLEEAEPHLAEIDEVAEWINTTVPIPTYRATTMMGKLLKATAAIRALKSETKP